MKVANISFLLSLSAKNDMDIVVPTRIKQICVALLVIAIEAIRENGEVILSTVNPDDLHIRIDVTDNGIGISDDDLPHNFRTILYYEGQRQRHRSGVVNSAWYCSKSQREN
jgi:signal transduction histidine kinase